MPDATTADARTSASATTGPGDDGLVLSVQDLAVAYGGTTVLEDVRLTLAPGEKLALVGESGSGKSTTIAAILGLLPGAGRIIGGSIRYRGQELVGAPEAVREGLRGQGIALVPQDPMSNLNPTLRVGDHVADALRASGRRDRDGIARDVVRLMTEAGIPDAERRRRQFPHEFSGGMRQRVLIAIALAGAPDVIIADEPTSALDVSVQKQILDHLEHLVAQRGMSLLLVTHDLGVAADRTDTILVMHRGRVVERGTPATVLRTPAEDYTRRLVAASPTLEVTPREESGAATVGPAGSSADGAADGSQPQAGSSAGGGDVLRVQDLRKTYRLRGGRGEVRALDGISLSAPRGRTTAIIGESGSGKSTLAKIVLGLETADSGTVHLDGQAVGAASRAERRLLRRFAQPVFQDPYSSLDPTWTIERIIAEPLAVFGIGSRAERRDRVAELLDQVAMPRSAAARLPGELSGGQRQRVAIARALSSSPQLLVCDEAVSALDVLVQDQILELLGDLQHRLGVSCLFITHDLAVVANLADQVVVMHRGGIVEAGPTDRVISDPAHDYTRGLLEAAPGREFMHV
ncbi:ABC transporter ATP-binding protein [Brachybacterium phenoliresistens]|uniref:ABC transporter ATP-binding protein n=1 Tax=Brachybacterium phenoliresistens TaxID=396014 RepID=Z9JX76_9MICO|nr:ABC transporter ATP-binding protein [Brachybacterium phenoliresistens]EWS82392.1 ABC transporter ATP-binding protein [Brachybacterium phenoliresistens]